MVKEYLENLKCNNNLSNYVIDYYIDRSNNYDNVDELFKEMGDLQNYGCISGMICPLIYYDQTIEFFDKYKAEINNLLADLIYTTGCSMNELFGDKYNQEDPLNLEYENKNLLAWFGFEETSRNLYEKLIDKNKNLSEAEYEL